MVKVELVSSAENWADQLTRVPSKWLWAQKETDFVAASIEYSNLCHCHFGIDRTLELARARFGEQVSKKIVEKVVAWCNQCA